MLQPKMKLPKVNRNLAQKILENEEAENEKTETDDIDTKKKSKKKKTLGSEVFKDERFAKMFENKVRQSNQMEVWLKVLNGNCKGPAAFLRCLCFWPIPCCCCVLKNILSIPGAETKLAFLL